MLTTPASVGSHSQVRVRPLDPNDFPVYEAFRQEIWPLHQGAGDWETVSLKYFANPNAAICPASGLYGCFVGSELKGIMGAYPMPVSYAGTVYPGHMVVDWAVPRQYQTTPIPGVLWQHVQALPGAKFASSGTPDSQDALARRATMLRALELLLVISPLPYLLGRGLGLSLYAQPSPLHDDELPFSEAIGRLEADQLALPAATAASQIASVARSADYWRVLLRNRIHTGAVALRVGSASGEARFVGLFRQIGIHRTLSILDVTFEPRTAKVARHTAAVLRPFLKSLKVISGQMMGEDDVARAFADALAVVVRARPAHWWHIGKSDDPIDFAKLTWRLTLADRDSSWGRIQAYSWRKK